MEKIGDPERTTLFWVKGVGESGSGARIAVCDPLGGAKAGRDCQGLYSKVRLCEELEMFTQMVPMAQ